jgi:phosphoglycerate dehydrogenase-like enzyme
VINSDDLADALEQGEIFGAGLDVITGEPNIGPDHRLVKAKNCTFTYILRGMKTENRRRDPTYGFRRC